MGAVVSKLAFRAPTHPTYNDVDGKMLFIRKKHGAKRGEIMEEELIYLDTATGNRIPSLFMKQPNAKHTIIYSHANMEDLGLTARFCSEMSDYLGANVFVYEYTGKQQERDLKQPPVFSKWRCLQWFCSMKSVTVKRRKEGTAVGLTNITRFSTM